MFGDNDPRDMPGHLFFNALDIDYSSAVKADISLQDYSVCPRHWYIDARFRCEACAEPFPWPAEEQRAWFETYHFYILSRPKRCRECRAKLRDVLQLRSEYNALVGVARAGGSAEQKQRIVELVDDLETYWGGAIPDIMRETRDAFRQQLSRRRKTRPTG
jgi:hypothetical protein